MNTLQKLFTPCAARSVSVPRPPKCGIIRGMKMIAVTCALICASAFGAVMPQLPEPVYADTEVCTNVPCAALCECKM